MSETPLTYHATPVTVPVFDAVEVGETTSQLSTQAAKPLTIPELAQLLSVRGAEENKPGWILTPATLYRRVAAINTPIRQFQWYPGIPLSVYQVWVVIRIHENLFILTPAKTSELIQVLTATEQTYSKETYEQWKNSL